MSEDRPVDLFISCPRCANLIQRGQTFCDTCGFGNQRMSNKQDQTENPDAEVTERFVAILAPEDVWPCKNCGKPIPYGATYCASCRAGAPQRKPESRIASPMSLVTLFCLCCILSTVGYCSIGIPYAFVIIFGVMIILTIVLGIRW